MEHDHLENSLSDGELSELAAYADGSLKPRRRGAVEARLAESDELRALVEGQRRAIAAVRAADVRAPDALRQRISQDQRRRAPAARRRRIRLGEGLAAALLVSLALALALPGDVPNGPTIVQAAQLSSRPATAPAPRGGPGLLAVSSGRITFPDWGDIRWPATGTRTDRLGDRRIVTVFYIRNGRTVAYSIVAGKRLAPPVATTDRIMDGVRFRHFVAAGLQVVTWERDGQTCILSGRHIKREILFKLAGYRGRHPQPAA